MISGHRKYLIIGLVMIAAILLAALGAATYLVNSAKPRLEKIASTSLGMQVTCRKLRVSFLPPSILAREVKISNHSAEVALIPTLRARIDLRRLVKGQVLVPALTMEKPDFTITRLENGTWNIETPKQEKKETTVESPFLLPSINIRDGSLILSTDENPLEIRGISFAARDLLLTGDKGRPLIAQLSLTGTFNCRELQYDKTIIRDFASHLQGTAGSFALAPVTFPAFGGTAAGKLEVNMRDEIPLFGVHLELSRIQAGDFFASMTKEELLHGEMELALDITARGVTQQEWLHSISGKASMTGRDLTTIRLDLDNLVEDFIQSQQFHLVDIGAIMILGPLGPVLTRSYDFSMLVYSAQGGSSDVRQLVSLWEIDKGRAVALDVALATEKSRIAMSGEVDIGAKSFRKLVVAIVDANGCALVGQEINGPFENPQVDKPSFIETAAGPIINIFRGTARLITGEKCEVFYNGSVAAPRE
jgi:AsmA protein